MTKENRSLELRAIQRVQLNILKQVVAICNEHKLTYYISGGTFLGAVRHKGFIPWDDDIDIALPREDYQKLIEITQKRLPSPLKIVTYTNRSDYNFLRAQVRDPRFEIQLNDYSEPRTQPTWIDIFPLDGVPSSLLLRSIWKLYLSFYELLWGIARIDEASESNAARSKLKQHAITVSKRLRLGRVLDAKKWTQRRERALRRVSFINSKYCFNGVGVYKFKSIFDIDAIYGEGKDYLFESLTVNGPSNSDAYLRQIYGNYNDLPPLEKRNWHGTSVNVRSEFLTGYIEIRGLNIDFDQLQRISMARSKSDYLFVGFILDSDHIEIYNSLDSMSDNSAISHAFELTGADEIITFNHHQRERVLSSLPVSFIFR